VGLVEPEASPERVIISTLDAFLHGYIKRNGKSRKPATVAVWKQVYNDDPQTEHTEHSETNPPTVMSSFRGFGVFRG
jgi:hypothetical protein